MKVVVVYNPRSGSALPRKEVASLFKQAGISIIEILDVTKPTTSKRVNKYAQDGTTVAAIGGDGTIASITNEVVGTKGILAPLPGGTLNHFTKDAGVSQDLSEAIAHLKQARPRQIDVAAINGHVFLNNSSIGIYPSSLVARERIEGSLGKWPAAVIASIRAFLRFKLHSVTIEGQEFLTPFLFIGNNDYHMGDTNIVPGRTKLNQGFMSVYMISSTKRRDILILIAAAIIGRLRQQDNFITFKTKHVTIHTKTKTISVSTDGEVSKQATPLEYTILAKQLTII